MMQKLRKLAIFGPIWLLILPNASHGGLLQAAPDEHPRRILAFLDQYLLDKSDD